MKSRTSFFNRGVSRNLLRRCWPLWAGYALLLLLLVPVADVFPMDPSVQIVGNMVNSTILYTGGPILVFSFFMGLLSVRFLFGYLFEKRGSGMMASLPVRRESLFFTAWLTGLVPTLLLNLLWILLAYLRLAGYGLSLSTVGVWLLATTCGLLCFYGLAVLCAMLTGSRVIFPLLYLSLSFAAAVLQACGAELLDTLVYGYVPDKGVLYRLSPPVGMIERIAVQNEPAPHLEGLGMLGIYGAAGLVLSVLALLLYRKRHMETATDNIAVRSLKPVFKYGLSLAAALVSGTVIFALLWYNFYGSTAAAEVLILMLIGAFLGYFAAEMLLQKTVKVFKGRWKGFLAVAAALILFVCCAEFDVFGFERRVPAPEQVERVSILWNYADGPIELEQPESLVLVEEVHRGFVEHKARNDLGVQNFRITYTLKNGQTLTREYSRNFVQLAGEDNREELLKLQNLLNCRESREKRAAACLPLTLSGPSGGSIWISTPNGNGGMRRDEEIQLSFVQIQSLYQEGILPDLEQGTLGRIWVLDRAEDRNPRSNVSIHLQWVDRKQNYQGSDWEVCMDSENCLRWLEENLGIVPTSRNAG